MEEEIDKAYQELVEQASCMSDQHRVDFFKGIAELLTSAADTAVEMGEAE